MIQLIDIVPFKHKYTSGVISFAKEDMPTNLQIDEVMSDFEELAFAWLQMSSRSILWVQHEHVGRSELYYIIPQQEIHKGKSFNAFPPLSNLLTKKYDHLRDKYNYKYGWACPDDVMRARNWQPSFEALKQAEAKRANKSVASALGEQITAHSIKKIQQDKITNRQELVQELRSMGYSLPSIGKEYLTILEVVIGKRTRLKGTIFHNDFEAST